MSGLKEVWVSGEALIDLVPRGEARVPIVGGGPANTAKALSNLGFRVSFIGGISSDDYGAMIREELDGVDLSLALKSNLPTALAKVSLNASGSASYEFSLEGTATLIFGANGYQRASLGYCMLELLGQLWSRGQVTCLSGCRK